MKRILKWSLILGSICCIAGIGTITAGAVMGGGMHLANGLHHAAAIGRQQIGRETVSPQPVSPQPVAPGSAGDDTGDGASVPGGAMDGEKNRAVPGTEDLPVASSYTYSGVRRLDIEMLFNYIELRERDDVDEDTIIIGHAEDAGSAYDIRQNGDKLELKVDENARKLFTGETGMEPLLIYIPRGFVFDEVEIENNLGNFQADTLSARKLSLECISGDISIGGGSVQSLDAECSGGSISCLAAAAMDADVECEAGSVDLLLSGVLENYDYDMECEAGSILLNGKEIHEYTGLNRDHHMNHHTGHSVDLECRAGSISVNFPEPVM